jgi:hypothetical protein
VKGSVSYKLAPGMYYVKVERYYGTVYSYTLTSTFAPALLQNDPEPNNVFTSAAVMPLNGSVTGHIGYYSNSFTDTNDWWKVTTTQDGELTVKMEVGVDPGSYLRLYDINGNRELTSLWISGIVQGSVSYKLAPGTYYMKVERYYGTVYSYTLTSSFIPAPLLGDREFNNHPETAVPINLNSQHTGHIYYYSNNWFDDSDWYKVQLPAKGTLVANLAANVNPGATLRIYDENLIQKGSVWIDSLEPRSVVAQNLEAGVHYIKVELYYRLFSYILSTTFVSGTPGAPRVIATYPAGNSAVSIQDFVTATFSEIMNPSTITSTTFILKNQSGVTIRGTVGYVGTVASYYPDDPMEVGQRYTATITTGVQNTDGTAMASAYTWSFTVGTSDVDIVVKGDVNADGHVDLSDVILCLQVLSGLAPANIHPAADVDGDGKIGIAEAIYAMQKVAGL